jgi:hypothetical protein
LAQSSSPGVAAQADPKTDIEHMTTQTAIADLSRTDAMEAPLLRIAN